jgi:cytochrome c1
MDGKGQWVDHMFIKRWWLSFMYKGIYLYAFDTFACSGLMEQDTFMRDNIVNHEGVSYDAKTQLQAVPERV